MYFGGNQMAKKIEVTKLMITERDVSVFVDDNSALKDKHIQPEGRMLADSDHLAFIYILDVEEDFIYVSFPETVWSHLNIALNKNLPLFLYTDDDIRIPLLQFQEELLYFISNIAENSNYGKKMVDAVSHVFSIEM